MQHIRLLLAAGAFLSFCVMNASADVSVSSNSQISVGAGGRVPSGSSGSPAVSSNGKIIVFRSQASNLLSGGSDQNGENDVYEMNLESNTVTRSSVSGTGVEADGASTNPSVTFVAPDGFYAVAFESAATNLGKNPDTNSSFDIYVRIPSASFTELVSRGQNGVAGNGDSKNPSIAYIPSSGKIRVAYLSEAANLVPSDGNNAQDVFVTEFAVPADSNYDPATLFTTRRISVDDSGLDANGESERPRISADGRYVVFASSATDLTSAPVSNKRQVYRYDLETNTMMLVSKTASGAGGNGDSTAPSISYSGRYITYLTKATDILPGSVPGKTALFLFDALTGVVTRVNTDESGASGNQNVQDATISPSGRFVSFSDSSSNLITGDANGAPDIYVKDLETGDVQRISRSESGGDADAQSDLTYTAARGFTSHEGLVPFRSFASNISPGDTESGAGDIFLNSPTLDSVPFRKGRRLEVPPDLTPGRKKVSLTMEQFGAFQRLGTLRASKKPKVQYEIRVERASGKKQRIDLVSKRNRITVRKLKPGTVYQASYRVMAVNGSKTVAKTPFSPKMQFKAQ